MNAYRSGVSLCLVLAAMTSLVFGQPGPLKGSSSFEVNIGLWNEAQAGQQLSVNGIKQSARASGFVGGLGYSYWMREFLAVTFDASMLSGEASSTISVLNIQHRTNSVVSVLIGMRYYLPEPEPEDRVRPFVALGIGSYIGSEAENSIFVQSAHSESVIGGRLGVGIDALLGSWFKLNATVAYNLMADFRTPVGARSSFNGYDMSFGFGFVF
jgi:hypothetical protein